MNLRDYLKERYRRNSKTVVLGDTGTVLLLSPKEKVR